MEIVYKEKRILIDECDLDLLNKYGWCFIPARQSKQKFYLARGENKKTIYFHRELMNAKIGDLVDHENRDTLDFTRKNLRFISYSNNRRNSEIRINSRSGHKCINKKRNGRFVAYANILGKRRYIGTFETIELAIEKRDLFLSVN